MQRADGNDAGVPTRRTRIAWHSLVLAVLALLTSSLPMLAASTEDTKRDYGCSTELKVAVFEFGPWYENGKGITVDLLDAVQRKTGCSFELVDIPRAEAWAAIANGDVDLIPTSIQTSERLKVARFVTFLQVRNLMIVRADLVASLVSLDAIVADRSQRVGLINGFLYGSYFDLRLRSLLGDDRTLTVDDPRELVDLLRQGRVSAILMPSTHYFSYVPEMERQMTFRVVDTSVAMPQPSGFALSRRTFSSLQTDNWLRLMESMFLDGSLDASVSRHLPPRIASTITRR